MSLERRAHEGGARAIRSSCWAAALAVACALVPAASLADGLTTVPELAAIRQAARDGVEPHASNRDALMQEALRPWRWGRVAGTFVTTQGTTGRNCHPQANPDLRSFLLEGAPDSYAMALGAHLSDSTTLALAARSHVLDLVDTEGFHGLSNDHSGSNKCVLDLAFSIPVWIETAELLEHTNVWSPADSVAFKQWLAREAFPRVAWASRVRRNNWGTAGSAAAHAIARYVEGEVATLEEQAPVRRTLTPAEAAAEHVDMQKARIGTQWRGDSRCEIYGVREHGGIPDELRRGSAGCSAVFLRRDRDGSYNYQTMHAELLVLHAEALRRQGDSSLFDLEAAPGRPAILQAILFVIANPDPSANSWPWKSTRRSTLLIADAYYDDDALSAAAAIESSFRGGRNLPYGSVTHEAPIAVDEAEEGGEEGDGSETGGEVNTSGTTPLSQSAGRAGRPYLID